MTTQPQRGRLDALEPRRLLSVTPFARVTSRGTLLVFGDGTSNTIAVRLVAGQVQASRDGQNLSFDPTRISRIYVDTRLNVVLLRHRRRPRRQPVADLRPQVRLRA
jgi:hypothetical protein